MKDMFWKKTAGVLLMVFIAVFSIFVCSSRVPSLPYFTNTVQELEDTNDTVMLFSGATLATAVVITLLPDDWASPLANELADLNKYVIAILAILFFEKLIVIEGVSIVFSHIIPIICALFAIYIITHYEILKSLAVRLLTLALALVFAVPFSTNLSNSLSANYKAYIDETITAAEAGADKVDEITSSSSDDKSFFENVSSVFQTAIHGIKDLFDYFSNVVKKCVNTVAIFIIITFVIPVVTFVFLIWLLDQLFHIGTIYTMVQRVVKVVDKREGTDEEDEEE